jgi:hypothetical protein
MISSSPSDAEELLNHLVPAAEDMIEKEGTFPPFGAVVSGDGRIEPIPVKDMNVPLEDAEPDEVFVHLVETLKTGPLKGTFRTLGLCADVHVVREELGVHSDAFRVFLERENGDAMNVFLPYEVREDGGILRGEIFAVEAEPMVFGPGAD